MCCWLAYSGPSTHPDELLFRAENSLVDQSMSALLGATPINGDSFGIGWHGERDDPGLFRGVHPTWNDYNRKSIAKQVSSGLFYAHVGASTSAGISPYNGHPFRLGK